MGDFLLVLIELFSPALPVEALWADIGRYCNVWKGWVNLSANFREKGVVHQQLSASLAHHVALFARSYV